MSVNAKPVVVLDRTDRRNPLMFWRSNPEDRDAMTLARLVERAVDDVAAMLSYDPHLLNLLSELAGETDQGRIAGTINDYIASAVLHYLSNRRRQQAVRRARINCLVSASGGMARGVIEVRAWGHVRAKHFDLELPK